MKITKIARQSKRPERYSIYVDDKYEFSVHEQQLAELGLKSNQELTNKQLEEYKDESIFGKAYERTLKYILIRPRSRKEVNDYLVRTYMYPKPKVFTKKDGTKIIKKQTVDKIRTEKVINRVVQRLDQKGYLNDESFAKLWVQSRQLNKKPSKRKLQQELVKKGIVQDIIATTLQNYEVTEIKNLKSLIDKKRRISKYKNNDKLIPYLLRQGFNYGDINDALSEE